MRARAGGRGVVVEVIGGSKPFLMLSRQQPKAKRAEAVLGFSGVVVMYREGCEAVDRAMESHRGRECECEDAAGVEDGEV